MRTIAAAFVLASVALAQDEAPKLESFPFKERSLGGQPLEWDAFRGNVLLVDLWGTWCPPCREAVPVLVELYEKYKHHGLEIVGFCFAKDGSAEDVDKVRAFAVEHRITYPLVSGTAAVRDQVPGFRGYPTLLLFGRDGVHLHTHVGFDAEAKKQLDELVRKALGLETATAAAAEPAKEVVPKGKIFEPGNGDRGLELEVEDLAGETLSFAGLRGEPVLLALTSSWDQEAGRTAAFLQRLHQQHPRLRVVAWHLEQSVDPAKKAAAARAFLQQQNANYRAFTTDLGTARDKVYRFQSLPTLLLFDAEGVLVLREGGISDAIEQRVQAGVAKQLE